MKSQVLLGSFLICSLCKGSSDAEILHQSAWVKYVQVAITSAATSITSEPWAENYPGSPKPVQKGSIAHKVKVTVEWSSSPIIWRARQKLGLPLPPPVQEKQYIVSVAGLPEAPTDSISILSSNNHPDIKASHYVSKVVSGVVTAYYYFPVKETFKIEDIVWFQLKLDGREKFLETSFIMSKMVDQFGNLALF